MFPMFLDRCRRSTGLLAAASVLALGCGGDGLGGLAGPNGQVSQSVAYDNWTPGANDTCTPAIHNRYSAIGPDGKLYPTWHPAIDPETDCTFGHEHGRDPQGSDLFAEWGPVLFGYANEQLDTWDPTTRRHEDHVGHKIEWENDLELSFGDGAAGELLSVECDALIKMHQGSHSKDAFTNNLHEVAYHIRCSEGTEMHVTAMTAIGTPGEFVANCDGQHIFVGTPTPPTSPEGGGQRILPTRACIEAGHSLRESWQISQSVRAADGHTLASFNPYFNVSRPSRMFDPAATDNNGRPLELCYASTPPSSIDGTCEEATNGGSRVLAFDDPASPFDGVRRDFDINGNRINNADGPEVWHTDPFGKNGRRNPFPGSVQQWIAAIDNDRAVDGNAPSIGGNRNYKAKGVHAPN